MKLSIVILVCDKDVQYLLDIIKTIKERVKINYEIIVMDNTLLEEVPFLKNVLIVRPEIKTNLRQLEARKRSCKYVTGDYIWFVDADDEVLEINKKKEYTEDIIAFDYMYGETITHLCFSGRIEASLQRIRDTHFACWNKWFKTDLLKKAFENIYDDSRVSIFEDNLINALAMKEAKTIFFENQIIYKFRKDRSFSVDNNFESIEALNIYLGGLCEVIYFFRSNFTEQEIYEIYQDSLIELFTQSVLKRVLPSLALHTELISGFCDIMVSELPIKTIFQVSIQMLSTEPDSTFNTLCDFIKALNVQLPLKEKDTPLHNIGKKDSTL